MSPRDIHVYVLIFNVYYIPNAFNITLLMLRNVTKSVYTICSLHFNRLKSLHTYLHVEIIFENRICTFL